MITSKIPKEVFIQLELQKGARNKWTVRELRELFSNYVVARERADVDSYGTGGEDCYSCVNSTGGVNSYGTGGEDCYSCVNSTADVDSYGTGGEDCYSCVNSTADVDSYGAGGADCYSCVNSTGGVNSYGSSDEDCFSSCGDSTGKKDDSSYEDQTPGKWCCSLNISTFHEEFFSCYNKNRDMYYYMCKDGKKDQYVNSLGCARSGEDYSVFEDRDRGKPRKFCENVFGNENCTNYFGRNVDKNRHEVCTKNLSHSTHINNGSNSYDDTTTESMPENGQQ